MKRVCLITSMLYCVIAAAQEVSTISGDCGRPPEILVVIQHVGIERSEDPDYIKLFGLDYEISRKFASNSPSYKAVPVTLSLESKNFLPRQQKYILYGVISSNKGNYILNLILQTTCGEQVLAKTDVSFKMDPSWDPVAVADEVVRKINTLFNFRQFELDEREKNKIGLGGDIWGGKIKITIMNKALQKGEETDVLMEVVDCDGRVLPGKLIKTIGTSGGVFTPSSFTTNGQGIGKVKFKLTSEKDAIIKAQCETKNVLGCQDLYTGTEILFRITNGYKVVVRYQKTGWADYNLNSDGATVFQAREISSWNVGYTFSLFHSISTPPKDEETIMIMPGFENDPEMKNKLKGKTIVLNNTGYAAFLKNEKPLTIVASPVGAPPSPQSVTTNLFSTTLSGPVVHFQFKNNELVFFTASVDFPKEEDGLYSMNAEVGIEKNDKKYFPLKPKKVTDPKSPYKWVYEFEFRDYEGTSNPGAVFNSGSNEFTNAYIQIWKTF